MSDNFTIAVASGKGGTGKTTIAANLASYLTEAGENVRYLDCDVEEPNGHIFLKANITTVENITVDVPQVDLDKCTACGKCGEICQFGAIVCIKEHVMTFEPLCHSCGGCRRICPADAIGKKPVEIGRISVGKAGKIDFVTGKLRIGNVRTPSLIKQVKKHITDDCISIIDVPPGTSCPVVEAIRGVDFVLLVTEPTPFGLNDLKLAVGLVRQLGLPFAVIINRHGIGDERVEQYCQSEDIDIAMKLPDDRKIAEVYSSGGMIVDLLHQCKKHFAELLDYLECAKEKLNEKRRLRI
ncbi:MAG: ATP-binding protein [Sedimentisphaerales bacterium]|nr:ATP-binding protein [Sedimentisphaerales bacterium]